MDTASLFAKEKGGKLTSDVQKKASTLNQRLDDNKTAIDNKVSRGYEKIAGKNSETKYDNGKTSSHDDPRKDFGASLPPINESEDKIRRKTKELENSFDEQIKGNNRLSPYKDNRVDGKYGDSSELLRNQSNKRRNDNVANLKDNADLQGKVQNNSRNTVLNGSNESKDSKGKTDKPFYKGNIVDHDLDNKNHMPNAGSKGFKSNRDPPVSRAPEQEGYRGANNEKLNVKQRQDDTSEKHSPINANRRDDSHNRNNYNGVSKIPIHKQENRSSQNAGIADTAGKQSGSSVNSKDHTRKNIQDRSPARSKFSGDDSDRRSTNTSVKRQNNYNDSDDNGRAEDEDDKDERANVEGKDKNRKDNRHLCRKPTDETDRKRREYIKTHYGGSFDSHSDHRQSGDDDDDDDNCDDNDDKYNNNNRRRKKGLGAETHRGRRPTSSLDSQEEDNDEVDDDEEEDEAESNQDASDVEMLDQSSAELKVTIDELERRYDSIENEGNEWKTRYETQTEMNQQLAKQILLLQEKVEEAKRNLKEAGKSPRDCRGFDDLADASPQMVKALERERNSLCSQLKDMEWRLDQESKAYHKANDERKQYVLEINATKVNLGDLRTKHRQTMLYAQEAPPRITSRSNLSETPRTYRDTGGNIPEGQRILDPRYGPIRKTAGVKALPSLD